MTVAEAVTLIAAVSAAVAAIAAAAVSLINALQASKTHVLVNGLSTRATQLERKDASTSGYAAGVQAEHERQSSADPPK